MFENSFKDLLQHSLLEHSLDTFKNPIAVPELNVVGVTDFEHNKKNVIACFKRHRRTKRVIMEPAREGTFTVVGYGPSLRDTFTGVIDETIAGNAIMTVSGAHDYCISQGVVPDYHAELDARERKAEFLNNAHKDVTYLMASVCHPAMWDKLKGHKVKIWHLGDRGQMDNLIAIKEPGAIMIPSMQCVGLNAVLLGYVLGYRRFSLYGLDCSYREGEAHPGWHNGTNDDERRTTVIVNNKEFVTRIEWIQYARNFVDQVLPALKGCRVSIHGDGLLANYCKAVKEHTKCL